MAKFNSTPRYSKMRLISEDEYNRLKQKIVRDYDPRLSVMASVSETAQNSLIPNFKNLNPIQLTSKLQQYHHAMDTFKTLQDKNRLISNPYPELQTSLPQLINPIPNNDRDRPEHVQHANAVEHLQHPNAVEQEEEVNATANEGAQQIENISGISSNTLWNLVLKTVDNKNREKVKYLIENIKIKPEILSISSNLEVVYNSKLIPDTTFIDLFNWLFSHHSSKLAKSPPKFASEFLKILNTHFNLDPSSIATHVRNTIQIGEGKRSFLISNHASLYKMKRKSKSLKNSFPPGKKPHILRVY